MLTSVEDTGRRHGGWKEWRLVYSGLPVCYVWVPVSLDAELFRDLIRGWYETER